MFILFSRRSDLASASAHRNYQQGRQNNFSLAFGAVVVSVSVSVFNNVMDGGGNCDAKKWVVRSIQCVTRL